MKYSEFIERKAIIHRPMGIEPQNTNEALFPFQRDIVNWSLRRGRCAILASTGLGKTAMQCEWARQVEENTKKPVLIFAPLAVASQTVNEAMKILGVEIVQVESKSDIGERGIYITNYQKLHRFDTSAFGGVVIDESSILKHTDGKYRTDLTEAFAATPFRLACTATPAPNDFMEIGNHAEFLGVMRMSEMLSTFFVHDGDDTQKWRLKGHAQDDFWRWMASWAACIQNPSDLGYEDDRYTLPPLIVSECIVESNMKGEDMFGFVASTLQERRTARRATISQRVEVAAKLANDSDEQWCIWCNLNEESQAITKAIPGAVEVTGADTDEKKTKSMLDFASGKIRVLVSKPSLCGFGMNFQSCHNTAYVGLSDSFEQLFQSLRRFWRFGQTKPVNAHLIISDAEGEVLKNLKRKEADAQAMQDNLVLHVRDILREDIKASGRTIEKYSPKIKMKTPEWLVTQ